VPFENDSIVISNEKKAVCAPEYGNDATNAYTRRSRPASFGRVGISAQSSCSTWPGR
jgi:hypothetical protein